MIELVKYTCNCYIELAPGLLHDRTGGMEKLFLTN